MNTLILSLFKNRSDADSASERLLESGLESKNISILVKSERIAKRPKEAAAAGAATGGVIGGIAGLLVGIGVITITGIGDVFVGGPLITALGLSGIAAATASTVSGGITGAIAGGIVGGLAGLGIPEHEAAVYESKIKEGAILLAVLTDAEKEGAVKSILAANHADEIRGLDMSEQEAPSAPIR